MKLWALAPMLAVAGGLMIAPPTADAADWQKGKQVRSTWKWEGQHLRRWYRHDHVEYKYDMQGSDMRDFGNALQGRGNVGGCAKAETVNGKSVMICPDEPVASYEYKPQPRG